MEFASQWICAATVCLIASVYLMSEVECGQICANCKRTTQGSKCTSHTTCNDNEICRLDVYMIEALTVLYDYGCTQACPHSAGPAIIGRRSNALTHPRCQVCCNDTRLCNEKLSCEIGPPTTTVAVILPKACSDLALSTKKNGTYTIYPFGIQQTPEDVYCVFDASGNAWTVIQRRFNGSVSFDRNWKDYQTGFGSANGEYWIGNDIIHQLTSRGTYKLRIEMSDFDGGSRYAHYSTFRVGDESTGYVMHVAGYSGNAGDSLTYNNGSKFTTGDRDNDLHVLANCAVDYDGGWWYSHDCGFSYLNGHYLHGHSPTAKGIGWYGWRGFQYSLKTSTMMIQQI